MGVPLPIIAVVALVVLAGLAFVYLRKGKADDDKDADKKSTPTKTPLDGNTVGLSDVAYLMSQLSPSSSRMDVLWAVASTPESIQYGLQSHETVQKIRDQRKEADAAEANDKKKGGKEDAATTFDLDDEGWDDDNDGEEEKDEETKRKEKLAAEADEQKKKDREQLQKATGKTQVKLEGFDDGVIGQRWVETTLANVGAWPPKDLGLLSKRKFDYNGRNVSALDHPGLRRNICMITGRLNSTVLNSHPDLLEAGSKQLIDQTYFKGSLDYRGRCGLLLEAALRSAVACRSYPLAKTIVEAVVMFKVGCSYEKTEWFDGVMQKTYQCLPRLQVKDPAMVNAEGQDEIIPGDLVGVSLELTRLHAESFTRQKIAMYQKQGIPPQVALQTYRESWWFLVRAERVDGKDIEDDYKINTNGILQTVDSKDIEKFKHQGADGKLITAWPMIVQNVAQKSGKVKIQFLSPASPGTYKFTIVVKSQDFLGADQEFSVQGEVLDPANVQRTPKEEESKKSGEDKVSEEAKGVAEAKKAD